jgi:hypothetical protein
MARTRQGSVRHIGDRLPRSGELDKSRGGQSRLLGRHLVERRYSHGSDLIE